MPKDESDGLLSRVAKLVRPGGGPAQGETAPPEMSRDLMRLMLERRRRNDFVRRREFAALRKMRRASMAQAEQAPTEPMASVAPPPDIRAPAERRVPDTRLQTLRKIEEIEHEMSANWPRRTGRAPTADEAAAPVDPAAAARPGAALPSAPPPGAGPGAERGLSGSSAPALAATPAPRARAFFRPTDYPTTTGEVPSDFMPATAAPAPAPAPKAQGGMVGATSSMALQGAPSTRSGDLVPEHLLPDPKIESASILFAGGNTAGALASLMAGLASGVGHEETWRALLDLYRATGQRQPFEALAAQLSPHFATPPWRDLRAGEGAPEAPRPGVLQLSGRLTGSIASMLKEFDQQVQGLGQVEISCAGLERIDFVAAGSLLNWVISQRKLQRQLRFVDAHRLAAAFLKVVGLAAHADIVVRTD